MRRADYKKALDDFDLAIEISPGLKRIPRVEGGGVPTSQPGRLGADSRAQYANLGSRGAVEARSAGICLSTVPTVPGACFTSSENDGSVLNPSR